MVSAAWIMELKSKNYNMNELGVIYISIASHRGIVCEN